MMKLVSKIAETHTFEKDEIEFVMKKVIEAIEDHSSSEISPELFLGDPHINSAIFIGQSILNPETREYVLACFVKILQYFSNAFNPDSQFKEKRRLFAFLETLLYEF